MNVLFWILQGLLAAAFLAAGGTKLGRSKEQLAKPMPWSQTWSPTALKALGAVEALGGLGVILPWALGIAPVLTSIAAVGLALVMVGAIGTHLRREEYAGLVAPAVLLIAAIVVAAGRL